MVPVSCMGGVGAPCRGPCHSPVWLMRSVCLALSLWPGTLGTD